LSYNQPAWSITGLDTNNKIDTILAIENVKIKGPDTVAHMDNAITATTGMEFKWVMDLQLRQVQVYAFHTGLYIDHCWPVKTDGCIFSNNHIGAHFDDNATIGWHQSQFDHNYYNLYLHGTVTCQTFTSCLFQNCRGNAITCDPGAGERQQGLQFINPYFENVMGNAFSFCTNLANIESAGSVFDVLISGGVWSRIGSKAIQGAVSQTGNVHSITMLNLYGIRDASDIGGFLRDSVLLSGNTRTPNVIWWWDDLGILSYLSR
jgi:hypothetical protein